MVIFKSLFRISCFFIKFQPFVCCGGTHCLRAVGGAFYSVINNLQSPLILLFLRCFDPDTNHIIAGFIAGFYRQLFSSAFFAGFRRLPLLLQSRRFFLTNNHITSENRLSESSSIFAFLPFCRSDFSFFVFRFSSFVFRWAAALDDEQDADQIAVFPFCGRNFHLPPLVRLNWYLISTNI